MSHPNSAQDNMFERSVTFRHGNASSSAGHICRSLRLGFSTCRGQWFNTPISRGHVFALSTKENVLTTASARMASARLSVSCRNQFIQYPAVPVVRPRAARAQLQQLFFQSTHAFEPGANTHQLLVHQHIHLTQVLFGRIDKSKQPLDIKEWHVQRAAMADAGSNIRFFVGSLLSSRLFRWSPKAAPWIALGAVGVDRFGFWLLPLYRLSKGTFTLVGLGAGISMNHRRFVVLDAIGAALWVAAMVGVGRGLWLLGLQVKPEWAAYFGLSLMSCGLLATVVLGRRLKKFLNPYALAALERYRHQPA